MRDFSIERRPLPPALAHLAFTVWKDAAGHGAGGCDKAQDAAPRRGLRALVAGLATRWARRRARAEFAALDPRIIADAGLKQESYCGEEPDQTA